MRPSTVWSWLWRTSLWFFYLCRYLDLWKASLCEQNFVWTYDRLIIISNLSNLTIKKWSGITTGVCRKKSIFSLALLNDWFLPTKSLVARHSLWGNVAQRPLRLILYRTWWNFQWVRSATQQRSLQELYRYSLSFSRQPSFTMVGLNQFWPI